MSGSSSAGALAGRRALVTGASRGIGRAVARVLAGAGATVHLVARSEGVLHALANEMGGAVAHPCDLTDAHAIAGMIEELQARETMPDILVNNAGIFPLSPVELTAPELFEQTVQANLVAPFRLVHAFLPALRAAARGDIVTIGSVADRNIFSGNSAYSASKFGVRALHEVLRTELAGTGVRCMLVSPAATDTSLWDAIDPDNAPGIPPRSAMLHAQDVADAVLWSVTRPPHVNIDELRLSRS